MVTPDGGHELHKFNGLVAKVPEDRVIEYQRVTPTGSNFSGAESVLAQNETPVALAGATGANDFAKLFKSEEYLNRAEAATGLCHAIAACNPFDACEIMAAALDDLSAGMPVAPLFSFMDQAAFWADFSPVPELKAYLLACYNRLPRADQLAFLAYVRGVQ